MPKSTMLLLVAAACCLTSLTPTYAATEAVPSPDGNYVIRIERTDSPDAGFPYNGARLVNARTGSVIQTLRPDDDLNYDAISALWSPDGTIVAVYYEHKRTGAADIYRIRNGRAALLELPEYSLPTKADLSQPSFSRFDYRKPARWSDPATLILTCAGKVQLKNASGGLLPEWREYEYDVQLQFGKDG
jgi:hypothetical protein